MKVSSKSGTQARWTPETEEKAGLQLDMLDMLQAPCRAKSRMILIHMFADDWVIQSSACLKEIFFFPNGLIPGKKHSLVSFAKIIFICKQLLDLQTSWSCSGPVGHSREKDQSESWGLTLIQLRIYTAFSNKTHQVHQISKIEIVDEMNVPTLSSSEPWESPERPIEL